ncbi:MAG: dicarboxylate/amino acid:cation symporter [Bacteroidetes bacterium]|nr:dicarboxylate/amino acid:cation symporter [Bacteroidota bacterium]
MPFRLPKFQLHTKILLALILGTLFGVMFNMSKYELAISRVNGEHEVTTEVVERWTSIEFVDQTGAVTSRFGPEDQLRILSVFGGLSKEQKRGITVRVWSDPAQQGGTMRSDRSFERVTSLAKVPTIAVAIKPIGTIFIRLLMFVAIPLVISSLIVGASSLGDLRKVGRIGAKTLGFYVVTIVSAVTIGLVLVNYFQPGTRLGVDSREKLMAEFQTNVQQKMEMEPSLDLVNLVVRIVSTNPFESVARGDMLQIVFFALMIGVSLTAIPPPKAAPVIGFFDGFSELMIKMVDMIMKVAPFGVFALISATVGEFGFEILQTLAWYAGTLLLGFVLHQFITLGLLVRVFGGLNPLRFFRAMKEVMLIGFSSSSSAATLPVNMETCEQRLGVPKQITSFVLPLGATINMDGTSMYQAVATVFIAQVYGLDLNLTAQLTILFTAVLASVGTAPVPGVGIVMLIIVLRSVNVPEEGIALILGVDRILDMCRTVLNVSGDAVVAVIMAKQEGVLKNPEGVAA